MKKLLAAAIAAAVAAPITVIAENNVTLYGKIHMRLTRNDTDNLTLSPTTGDKTKNWDVQAVNSRLGFKGTEDLGNGLKAIWKYEMTYGGLDACNDGGGGPVCGGDAITSARNSYVGLAGDWGTFLVGRHDTPEKTAWYSLGLDFLDESIIDLNKIGPYSNNLGFSTRGGAGTRPFVERRLDNNIAYISPSFSGFTIAASILPGENAGPGALDNDGFGDHYSIGGMFNANGIKLAAGYEQIDFKNTTANDGLGKDKTWFAGGSYTINGFTGGAIYESQKDINGGKGEKQAWAAAVKYAFGNNAVIGNWTQADVDFGGDDGEDYGFAFEHNFSKRTKAYAAYNYAKLKQNRDTFKSNQYGAGIIHLF